MKRIRLLVVAGLAASTVTMAASPAQARCRPEFAAVCQALVLVCDAIDRPCYA